jgi:hypothetical protein
MDEVNEWKQEKTGRRDEGKMTIKEAREKEGEGISMTNRRRLLNQTILVIARTNYDYPNKHWLLE